MRLHWLAALAAVAAVIVVPQAQAVCPQSGCYYPVITMSSPVTITAGQSTTVSATITGGDPAAGCSGQGAWSGSSIGLDGSGNGSKSQSVAPSQTTSYGVLCSGVGANTTVTVNPVGSPPPSPSPPPPPSSSPPYDYTCCMDGSSGSVQTISISQAAGMGLDVSAANTRCWHNDGNPVRLWRGRVGYQREVFQTVTWCAVYNRYITSAIVRTDQDTSTFCSSPGGTAQYRISGGTGHGYTAWHSEAFFSCDYLPWNPLKSALWVEGIYSSTGQSYKAAGGNADAD